MSLHGEKNSSLYDALRKESNKGHLFLIASGDTPLAGKFSYGSDVGNLHEMLSVSQHVSYFYE